MKAKTLAKLGPIQTPQAQLARAQNTGNATLAGNVPRQRTEAPQHPVSVACSTREAACGD